MDRTALEAVKETNMYEKTKRNGVSTLEDIMDDEDRAHLEILAMNTSTRASRNGNLQGTGTSERAFQVPFAVASVDVPEVVYKTSLSSIGNDILLHDRSFPFHQETTHEVSYVQDCYRLKEYIALAARKKTDKYGLGFNETLDLNYSGNEVVSYIEGGEKFYSRNPRMSNSFIGVDHGDLQNDEIEIGELANAGYKQLDATSRQLAKKLQREGKKSEQNKDVLRKRSLQRAGLDSSSRSLFCNYEKVEDPNEERHNDLKGENIEVPAEFVRNPVHNFETDPFRIVGDLFPGNLEEEYQLLTAANRKALEDETHMVNASIARVRDRKDEQLRQIRRRFLEDLRSKFVAPTNTQSGASQSVDRDEKNPGLMQESVNAVTIDTAKKKLQIGETNRVVTDWKPSKALCKLFDVPVAEGAIDEKAENIAAKYPISSQMGLLGNVEDEDEFKIHSIIDANGQRINLKDAGKLLIEDDHAVHMVAEQGRSFSHAVEKKPSTAFYSAVFNEPPKCPTENIAKNIPEEKRVPEKNSDTISRTRRNVHKTKASDFF